MADREHEDTADSVSVSAKGIRNALADLSDREDVRICSPGSFE
jgi:hypothetical protein